MEPWNAVLEKLTKPRYEINGFWEPEFWQVLESKLTVAADGSAMTVVLGARVPLGSRTYRLELAGKDTEAMDLIAAKIPSSGSVAPGRITQGWRFRYERITFAWVYWSKFSRFFFSFLLFSSLPYP